MSSSLADIPHSHGSIRNQMVHISHTEAGWLRGLLADPDARGTRPAPTEYPTRAAAFALWEEKSRALEDYVAGLDEEALQRVPPGMAGPVWQVLLHLVNHSTDHRASVLRALSRPRGTYLRPGFHPLAVAELSRPDISVAQYLDCSR